MPAIFLFADRLAHAREVREIKGEGTNRPATHRDMVPGTVSGLQMKIEFTRDFLLWSTVINYGILVVWFLAFVFAHDWMRRLHGTWFRLTDEQFDSLHYGGMAIYKVGILLFNLSPFLALSVLR
jgi:uncharacterized protein DUF6868